MKNRLKLALLPILFILLPVVVIAGYMSNNVVNNNLFINNSSYIKGLTPSSQTVTVSYTVDTSSISDVYGSKFTTVGQSYSNTITLVGDNNLHIEVPFTRTLERIAGGIDSVGVSGAYLKLGNGTSTSQSLSFGIYNIGKVESIVVDAYDSGAKHTLHVYVGGNNVDNISLPNTGTTYQQKVDNINLDGDISLVIDSTEKYGAIYFKSITIVYYPYYSEITDNTRNLEFSFARYMNVKMNMSNVCSGDYSQLESMWNNVSNKYDHYGHLYNNTYDDFNNFFKGLDSTYGWTPNLRDDFSWACKTYDVVRSLHPGFTAFIAR